MEYMPGFWSGRMQEEDVAPQISWPQQQQQQQQEQPTINKHRRTSAPAYNSHETSSPAPYIRGSYRHYMNKLIRSETLSDVTYLATPTDVTMTPSTHQALSASVGDNLNYICRITTLPVPIHVGHDIQKYSISNKDISARSTSPYLLEKMNTLRRATSVYPLNYDRGGGDSAHRVRRTGAVNTHKCHEIEVSGRLVQFPSVGKLISKYTAIINANAAQSLSETVRSRRKGSWEVSDKRPVIRDSGDGSGKVEDRVKLDIGLRERCDGEEVSVEAGVGDRKVIKGKTCDIGNNKTFSKLGSIASLSWSRHKSRASDVDPVLPTHAIAQEVQRSDVGSMSPASAAAASTSRIVLPGSEEEAHSSVTKPSLTSEVLPPSGSLVLPLSSASSPRSSASDEGCSLVPPQGSGFSVTPCSSEEDLVAYHRCLSSDSAVSLERQHEDRYQGFTAEENVFMYENEGKHVGDTGVGKICNGVHYCERDDKLGDESVTGDVTFSKTKSKGTNTMACDFSQSKYRTDCILESKSETESIVPNILDFFTGFESDISKGSFVEEELIKQLEEEGGFKLEDSRVELRRPEEVTESRVKHRKKAPYSKRKSTLMEEDVADEDSHEKTPDFHLKNHPSVDGNDELIEVRWQSTQTDDLDFPQGDKPIFDRRQSNQTDEFDPDSIYRRDSIESRRFSTQTDYNDTESLYSRRESIYFRPDCIELRRQSTQTEDNDFDYDYRRDSFDSRRGSIDFRRESIDFRRQSTQSFQTDDEDAPTPPYRYWRTPSVVVSDYSDETLAVTLEEIEQFRSMTTPSDVASSIGTGSGCSSVSVLDADYVLKTPVSRKTSCSSCSTLSGDEEIYDVPHVYSVVPVNKPSGWRKLRNIVQWTPFFQTYKKQRYPWVQLAGHQGNFKAGTEPGTILKKLCPKEELCFQYLMKDILRPYVPEYKGHLKTNDQDSSYLQLQDLLGDFTSPCVMDCKIGVRTYLEEELAKAKEKPKLRKDMYEKMIQIDVDAPTEEEHRLKGVTKPRYMVWRETISSTATLGFRIEGIKKSDGKSSKDFKTTKTRSQIAQAFKDFTAGYPQAIPKYIQRLKAIKATLEVSHFFLSHEVIGSSLLFVHDDDNTNIWLIDFAKTLVLPIGVTIDHGSKWVVGNHEDGYFIGINNLISIFSDLFEEQSQLPSPQVTTIITDASEEEQTDNT